ncbi:MAG: DUF3291 domain-containing protein [Chloroflexota bacterium]
MPHSVSTVTFFRFDTFFQRAWAFGQMQFAHSHLQRVDGLQFYKLMGSGNESGFSIFPDWGVYALLAVWENEAAAERFFQTASICQRYTDNSSEQWTLFLKTSQSKGLWSGNSPFHPMADLDEANRYVAVITRATIRWRRMLSFWWYVPTSQRPIQAGCQGLIFTKGIGDVPLVQMATFSLWQSFDDLKRFAYQSKEHRLAIQKTHQLGWYSEELFARFQPYRSFGTWNGRQPLPELAI